MASNEPRSLSSAQLLLVGALTLLVFFTVSFAAKSLEAYRLRTWRRELEREIARLETQRQEVKLEIERRKTEGWIDAALKETGRVPEGVISVRIATQVPTPFPEGVVAPEPLKERQPGFEGGGLFHNANWRAWKALLFPQD